MKSIATKTHVICIALMLLFTAGVRAEQVARFDSVPDKSAVRVYGTSTLHDWTVKTPSISGHIEFKFNVPADATAQQIREAIVANPKADVDVTIPVNTMKSGKKDMDKKMYEAMKRDKHPDIKYQLTKIELEDGTKADQEEFKVQTTGNLTVAGTTCELQMPMILKVVDSQHLQISGKVSMKMTDFKVKPPQAMFGTIKSGDKIKVEFEWSTARQSPP